MLVAEHRNIFQTVFINENIININRVYIVVVFVVYG